METLPTLYSTSFLKHCQNDSSYVSAQNVQAEVVVYIYTFYVHWKLILPVCICVTTCTMAVSVLIEQFTQLNFFYFTLSCHSKLVLVLCICVTTCTVVVPVKNGYSI
jgi:hypothetical protein